MKIAVFDSGFGSLSIIKPIQSKIKSEIIYFADQLNFPYGNKTKSELKQIILNTIKNLNEKFDPDIIIVGSNTPTLILDNFQSEKILGVLPPLKEAAEISKTNHIAILATQSAVKSKGLTNYIKNIKFSEKIFFHKINSSELVELVESGKFISKKLQCKKIIKEILEKKFLENNIDTVTLSSTHLPFLNNLLKLQFPNIEFLDPANSIAVKISKLNKNQIRKNSIKIFTSKNPKKFQIQLQKLGIKNKVSFLSF